MSKCEGKQNYVQTHNTINPFVSPYMPIKLYLVGMLAKAEGLLLKREGEAEKGEVGDEENEVKGTLLDGKG